MSYFWQGFFWGLGMCYTLAFILSVKYVASLDLMEATVFMCLGQVIWFILFITWLIDVTKEIQKQ